jgi:hypothetical protein
MKTKVGSTAPVDSLKVDITDIIAAHSPVMLTITFVNKIVVSAYVSRRKGIYFNILWHIDPLLGNDGKVMQRD